MEATTTFLQTQIDELKKQLANHNNCDYWKAENGRVQSQIISLIDAYHEDGFDSDELVENLCQIIDYSPMKEINFTATINFTGTIQIPAGEAEDFDLTAVLEDAYVDINHGDVVIDGYELYDASEC